MPSHEHTEQRRAALDPPAHRTDWLQEIRTHGRTALEHLPWPSGREEAWRFTDVSRLRDERFASAAPEAVTGMSAAAEARWRQMREESAAWALAHNGHVSQGGVADPALGEGVQLLSLQDASGMLPDLVRAHLGQLLGAEDALTARNLAAVAEGVVLHVPDGVTVADPIRMLHWVDAPGTQLDTRLLLVLGAGARVQVEVFRLGPDLDAPTRAQEGIEAYLGAGAELRFAGLQRLGAGVHLLEHARFALAAGAQLRALVGSFGASFARYAHQVRLDGPGAEADLAGGYFPGRQQHHEFWTEQDHRAPGTRSDLLYKGALGDTARTVYYGTIRVRPGAKGSDAYQNNRNLLLSAEAQAFSNPRLEIETDEVRCTHGAAVARIDEEPLFYLMSRGLSAEVAERLVLTGYFGELLQRFGTGSETLVAALFEQAVNEALARESVAGAPGPMASGGSAEGEA